MLEGSQGQKIITPINNIKSQVKFTYTEVYKKCATLFGMYLFDSSSTELMLPKW